MSTKKIGDKAAIQFMAKCVLNDWLVLTPYGDCDRFDLVIDRGKGFERVQIKNGRWSKGSVIFNTCSLHYHTKQGQRTKDYRKNYKGQIDVFGVFAPKTGKCYLVNVNDVGVSCASLRVDPTKAKNLNQIKWAKDFEI